MSNVILREGDTAYVQVPGVQNPAPWAGVSGIDWLELAKQKHRLVTMIFQQPDDILWGLVELIDAIQDQAEEDGHPVVYAYHADEVEEVLNGR